MWDNGIALGVEEFQGLCAGLAVPMLDTHE